MKCGDMRVWQAWHDLEPRGEDRQDILAAFLSQFWIGDKDKTPNELIAAVQDWVGKRTKAEQKQMQAFLRAQQRKRDRKSLERLAKAAKIIRQAKDQKNGKQH